MRLAFFGDVVGKSGREAVKRHLPRIRADLKSGCSCYKC